MNETGENKERLFENLDAEVDMDQLEQGLIQIIQNVRTAVDEVIHSIETKADLRFHTPRECYEAMNLIKSAEKLGLDTKAERKSLKKAIQQSQLSDFLDKGGPYHEFFKED